MIIIYTYFVISNAVRNLFQKQEISPLRFTPVEMTGARLQIYENTFKNKQKIFLFRTEIFIIFASLKLIYNF